MPSVGPLIMIAAGMSIGAFNGIAVGYLGMIPFVVTLAMMTVTNGAAVWLTGSISIADVPDVFVDPFFARYFGLPLSVIIARSHCRPRHHADVGNRLWPLALCRRHQFASRDAWRASRAQG